MRGTILWVMTYLMLPMMSPMNVVLAQPTIIEDYWYPSMARQCNPEYMASLDSSLRVLKDAVRNQISESKKLRLELSSVYEHNKQSRVILAKLIDTLHMFVSKMASRYPCSCRDMSPD